MGVNITISKEITYSFVNYYHKTSKIQYIGMQDGNLIITIQGITRPMGLESK